MNIINKVLLVLLLVCTLGATPNNEPPVAFNKDNQLQAVTLRGKALYDTLHRIYEQAWARATRYAEVLPNEMPKFLEEDVHWTMKVESYTIDYDMNGPIWYTDLFETGTSRVLAWYKTDPRARIENGIALPVNARIEMQVTRKEIREHPDAIEGILVHELIHYIHHIRIMNTKGWMTMWPGDGHNYMAYLKYVKGYDVPIGKY